MIDQADTFLYKLRFLFVGTLVVVSLLLLSFLLPASRSSNAEAKEADSYSSSATDMSGDPNVVAGGMALAGEGLGQAADSAGDTIRSRTQSAASAAVQSGRTIAQTGLMATVHAVGAGATFVGNVVGSGASFIIRIPGNTVDFVSNVSAVRAIIRPSDRVEVPIIDPNSPELRAALAALPPTADANQANPQVNAGPVWPIHGAVTTNFGVPHWPYQATHSGLDISDGRRSGVTPIKPFRPGRVVDTIRSNYGLGNHVVVDHGNEVTSVYAHLASIAVRPGQEVTLDTTLGFEGTTGASTGTHLHFEIRIHGQAADPRQFIAGQP